MGIEVLDRKFRPLEPESQPGSLVALAVPVAESVREQKLDREPGLLFRPVELAIGYPVRAHFRPVEFRSAFRGLTKDPLDQQGPETVASAQMGNRRL